MTMTRPLLLLFCSIVVLNCDGQSATFAYDLTAPDQKLVLPESLREISGLGFDAANNALITVQDEDGIVFLLDKSTGDILSTVKFHKDGDYEGVEEVNGKWFVINSSGSVFKIQNPGAADQTVEKFNDYLDGESDVEGLGYDPISHGLLLSCKNETHLKTAKCIYRFDLKKLKLDEEPYLAVRLQSIHAFLEKNPPIRRLAKVKSFFDDDDLDFSPSAIAVHPDNGHLYMTSSAGKMVLIMDKQGDIIHIEKLEKEIHEQPEGLCFDPEGNLYISNEGRSGKGVIYKFKPHQ